MKTSKCDSDSEGSGSPANLIRKELGMDSRWMLGQGIQKLLRLVQSILLLAMPAPSVSPPASSPPTISKGHLVGRPGPTAPIRNVKGFDRIMAYIRAPPIWTLCHEISPIQTISRGGRERAATRPVGVYVR